MRTNMLFLLACVAMQAVAQDISFDQGDWTTTDISQQRRQPVLIMNQMLADTIFVENIDNGELTMLVEAATLTRIEYDAATQDRIRRIDIRQEPRIDSMYVENIDTHEMVVVVQEIVKDIPNGSYEEFHPNGTIRLRGNLTGSDAQGIPKKTGEWLEWDMTGKVIRQETYP